MQRVQQDEEPAVTYVVNEPSEALPAVDAIPGDFEITTRTESRTRIWRDGHWQHEETTTRFESRG
jgi:hypothetical protein